jgi:hypothetical protein
LFSHAENEIPMDEPKKAKAVAEERIVTTTVSAHRSPNGYDWLTLRQSPKSNATVSGQGNSAPA